LREYQTQLEKLAYHDPLTGLPNRSYLQDRMQQDMANARRHQRKMAVCNIDLDGFKPINDHYGHETGDKVLQTLANRLLLLLRQEDTAARWGGDEFTVLINEINQNTHEITNILDRIQSAFNTPIEIGNIDVQLSSSIGIAVFPDDDQDADTLIRHADQAMYAAKQNGKNQYSFFDPDQDRHAHQLVQKITELMGAIANNELRLYYQPQVDLRNGGLHGVEALVRWQHPQQGLLPPAAFLPPLENHEASITLDMWVLETAIHQLTEWQQQKLDLQVSVNLTATTLEDSMFLVRLSALLDEHPSVSGKLQLEILETTSLYNLEQVTETVQQCIDLGVKVALDDFGTGFSSLTYLRRIPATTLKIDRSFVIDMVEDINDLKIVNGILKIAEALGKEVIAEGVETLQHGRELIRLGGILAQGYAIAKPMPAEEVIPWQRTYRIPVEWSQASISSAT
jgi:diguanylate cyclase (GGDEF)-like protein